MKNKNTQIMDMSTVSTNKLKKKYKALRDVMNHLEDDPENYTWTEMHKCNAGLIVRAIDNRSPKSILSPLRVSMWGDVVAIGSGAYTESSYPLCPVNGEPYLKIVNRLIRHGFSPQDIAEVEHLCNVEIRFRAGLSTSTKYHNRHGLLTWASDEFTSGLRGYEDAGDFDSFYKYIEAWAEIISEEINKRQKGNKYAYEYGRQVTSGDRQNTNINAKTAVYA